MSEVGSFLWHWISTELRLFWIARKGGPNDRDRAWMATEHAYWTEQARK